MTTQNGNIHIIDHPLVQAKLTTLRIHDLPGKDFRDGIKAISSTLIYEASRGLATEQVPGLQSPIAEYNGTIIPHRIGLVPILRAGIGMTDAALEHFPEARVLHLGLFRDKASLQVIEYYSKLPASPNVDLLYVLDPMIATANTIIAALSILKDWGVPMSNTKVVCVLGSRQGIERVAREFPEVEVWTAAMDPELTAEGYISPGLGDAGDRLFNTLHE